MDASSSVELVTEQFKTIWIILNRPIVQQQLLLLLVLVLVAALLSTLLERFVEQHIGKRTHDLLKLILRLDFSILALTLGYLTVFILARQEQKVGLLSDSLRIFWYVLIYQFFVNLLAYRISRNRSRAYRRRILLPLLLVFVAARLINNFIGGLATIIQFEIANLFGVSIQIGTLFTAAALLYFFSTCAWVVQDVLTRTLSPRSSDPAVVNTVVTIARYSLIGVGILMAARAIGVDLSTFALIGGGLSIGIGFGLQQIVSNFIAGIVLMFEQSLRPGDLVKIGDELGIVQRLDIRATVVRTYNNVEIIVPNERLLTSALTTYTKSDRLVRIVLPVVVSYGSDVNQVRQLLIDGAKTLPLVLTEPAPNVFIDGFGRAGINFRLMVWIDDALATPSIRSDLHFAVWEVFQANNIKIPIPQRELHLASDLEQLNGLSGKTS
ncbi:MAG: mechanosensitive ion channel family protein [Candidatus Promineifilaceae bacterium]